LRPFDVAFVAKVVSAKISSGHYSGVFIDSRPYVGAVTLTVSVTRVTS
jgi:hypothetical protein